MASGIISMIVGICIQAGETQEERSATITIKENCSLEQ